MLLQQPSIPVESINKFSVVSYDFMLRKMYLLRMVDSKQWFFLHLPVEKKLLFNLREKGKGLQDIGWNFVCRVYVIRWFHLRSSEISACAPNLVLLFLCVPFPRISSFSLRSNTLYEVIQAGELTSSVLLCYSAWMRQPAPRQRHQQFQCEITLFWVSHVI